MLNISLDKLKLYDNNRLTITNSSPPHHTGVPTDRSSSVGCRTLPSRAPDTSFNDRSAATMLKNQRNTLQARPGQPQPLQWADCHSPHVDTSLPGARSQAPARSRPRGTCEQIQVHGPGGPPSKGNQSASANPGGPGTSGTVDFASSAPRPAPGLRNVCRKSTHLHDSASHPRFYFHRDSAHKATPAEDPLPLPKVTTPAQPVPKLPRPPPIGRRTQSVQL